MNRFIEEWNKSMEAFVNSMHLNKEARENMLKAMAYQTLDTLEQNRPNKDKTILEQANEEQKELINYLNYIKETGVNNYERFRNSIV